MFNFDIIHVPGKLHMAPDATSRYPTRSASSNSLNDYTDQYSKAYAIMQSTSLPAAVTWEDVNNEAAVDDECIRLKATIESGFPESRNELPKEMRYYWPMRDDMFVIDNVPFKGRKMLIPKKLRTRITEGLHAAHQGITGMKSNARERLFWPGLGADITQRREQCRTCNENAPSQAAEPKIMTADPEAPFDQVVSDLCVMSSHSYLIYADRYSGWTEVAKI